jgi:ubiquinone/menaquinone biosynthesis C-methylase UbiE
MRDKSKIKEYFDGISPRRDYWKKKNRYYYEYIEEKLLPFLIPQGKNVLEIGCGTGDLLAGLKPVCGLGIDISEAMIKVASNKYNDPALEFRTDNIEDIDEKFDFVVMSDLVGYLNDVQELFGKLHKITLSRSRIVVT